MSYKVIHCQHIHCADNEWSTSGIMDRIAFEWLCANMHLIKDDEHICVEVYEHAGWFLKYTLDASKRMMVVGSANDAAQWDAEKEQWRERAYHADWRMVGPVIRREPQ